MTEDAFYEILKHNSFWQTSIIGVLSAFVVGLSGVIPLLFIPSHATCLMNKKDLQTLNRWLSYATGSLLGEVFIHLLPESWAYKSSSALLLSSSRWLLSGLILFFTIEKLAVRDTDKRLEGYLNLAANVVDNFTHGVAIGGSYLISLRLGLLTTICILIHEIPHEVADFAILLRSGFNRWEAAKAQFVTASGCTLGALLTLTASASIEGWSNEWIPPFTAGGFLYIALVSLVPDLLKELSPKESMLHLVLVLLGMVSMGVVSLLFE